MKKNCTTCLYEPKWYPDHTNREVSGSCRYPLPKWLGLNNRNKVFRAGAEAFDDMGCRTWTPIQTDTTA